MNQIQYVIESCMELKKDDELTTSQSLHWNEFYDDFKKIWREECPHLRLPVKKRIVDILCSHFETQIYMAYILSVRKKTYEELIECGDIICLDSLDDYP